MNFINKKSILFINWYMFFPATFLMGPVLNIYEFENLEKNNKRKMISYENLLSAIIFFQLSSILNYLSKDSLIIIKYVLLSLNIYITFLMFDSISQCISKLMGYSLISNFKDPFKSFSVSEFWSRYHISFYSFVKNFIFKNLFFKYKSHLSIQYLLIISWMISALIHGLNLYFMAWGLYWSLLILFFNKFNIRFNHLNTLYRIIINFTLFTVGNIFFIKGSSLNNFFLFPF